MKKCLLLGVGVLSSMLFYSCNKENKECKDCDSNKGQLVETVFYLDNGKPDDATRSVVLNGKEEEITSLKIGLYTNGTLNKTNTYSGAEKDNLTFSLYNTLRYNFYVIVNNDSFVFPQSESELSSKTISIPNYSELNKSGMYMSGVLKNVQPDGHTKFAFHVQRLFHRVVFDFSTSKDVSNIHIASAKILNSNSVVRPFGKSELVSPRTLVESSNEDFSKGGQLVMYSPESYSSTSASIVLEGSYMYKGSKVDCSKTIELNSSLERNTATTYNFFDMFVPDEGGVIVDPWTTPSMYVAQAKTLSFGVSGNSNFDVRISDNAGAKVMDLQKIGTRASGNTNVELKLGALKAGDYTIEIVKNGKVTDSKPFSVKKPTLVFDKADYTLSNDNKTSKFALSYLDEDNKKMSVSDFDSSLYNELLKPTAYQNPDSPINQKFDVINSSTLLRLTQDITSKDNGRYANAIVAKPMSKDIDIANAYSNLVLDSYSLNLDGLGEGVFLGYLFSGGFYDRQIQNSLEGLKVYHNFNADFLKFNPSTQPYPDYYSIVFVGSYKSYNGESRENVNILGYDVNSKMIKGGTHYDAVPGAIVPIKGQLLEDGRVVKEFNAGYVKFVYPIIVTGDYSFINSTSSFENKHCISFYPIKRTQEFYSKLFDRKLSSQRDIIEAFKDFSNNYLNNTFDYVSKPEYNQGNAIYYNSKNVKLNICDCLYSYYVIYTYRTFFEDIKDHYKFSIPIDGRLPSKDVITSYVLVLDYYLNGITTNINEPFH